MSQRLHEDKSVKDLGFAIWAATLVASLVVIGLCSRFLALRGVSSSASVLGRGLTGAVIVLGVAWKRGDGLWPRAPRTQAFRGVLAGAALLCFTASYTWLTASAVSVLANVDVPLLIVLAPFAGSKLTPRTRGLAFASIAILAAYVCAIERATGARSLVLGLSTLGVGSVLLCVCYALIKRSMSEENESVTMLVPALAMALFGALCLVSGDASTAAWDVPGLVAVAAAGAAMVVCYHATFRLYERTDLASAEFPTLIAAIVIQPLERVLLGASLEVSYLAVSVVFVAIVGIVVRRQRLEIEGAHA